MNCFHFSIGLFTVALFVSSVQVRAAVLLYDFENQPIFAETPFTLNASGVGATFSGAGDDAFGGAFAISSNFKTSTGFQYRLMNGNYLTIGSAFGAPGSPLTITFSVPINAFNVDFALDDPRNLTALTFTTNAGGAGSTGGALTTGFRYPEGTMSFFGSPFTSITFRSNAIDFQLDDIRASTAVPEPGSLWLMAAGLPAIGLLRRRILRAAKI